MEAVCETGSLLWELQGLINLTPGLSTVVCLSVKPFLCHGRDGIVLFILLGIRNAPIQLFWVLVKIFLFYF